MWKIYFTYSDDSKITITGKQKDISLKMAEKYQNFYGRKCSEAVYQQYPKKEHEPVSLESKIKELKGE